jgi:hypothetical protein
MMEPPQHSLFDNHPSRLVEEIRCWQPSLDIEKVAGLASDMLAVAHNLAASAVLVVAHNTEEFDFAAPAVESKNSVLVAWNQLVVAPLEHH